MNEYLERSYSSEREFFFRFLHVRIKNVFFFFFYIILVLYFNVLYIKFSYYNVCTVCCLVKNKKRNLTSYQEIVAVNIIQVQTLKGK